MKLSPILWLAWLALPYVCQLLQLFHPSFRRFHEESSELVNGEAQAKPSALGNKDKLVVGQVSLFG